MVNLATVKKLKKITDKAFNKFMLKGVKEFSHKSANDLLTDTDLKMDEYIKKQLKLEFPNCNLLTEESETDTKMLGYTFVVDPIDGTCNFKNGIKLCGIQIALFKDLECVLSIINLPYLNEFYHAILGQGAYFNGKKLEVNKDFSCQDGILELSDFYPKHPLELSTQFNVVQSLQSTFLKTRLFGAALIDFTNMATNKTQAYICYYYHIWDIAPGLLIATESGCVFSGLNKKYEYGDKILLVANNEKNLQILYDAFDKFK